MTKMNSSKSYQLISNINGWNFEDSSNVTSYSFEEIDLVYWNQILHDHWHWSFYFGGAYVALIFILQKWMSGREQGFELKYPLFVWNVILGLFSILGFVRTLPSFLNVLWKDNGFYTSICVKTGNVPIAFWGLLFVTSKVWELGDTLFIILRKRPLIFLQWYHHLATLIATWIVAPLVEPITLWYGILNYGVHSLMYPYFALKTLNIRIPTLITRIITTLQFAQMIIGLIVNLASFYLQKMGYDCARYRTSIITFSIIYGSFAVLFGKLLYDSLQKTAIKRNNKLE